MKRKIVIGVAAMTLAIASVPDTSARAWWGWHSLDLKLAGSVFVTSSEDGRPTPLGGVFTALASGIAKGAGRGIFSAQTVAEAAGPDERCGDMLFGADLSGTVVVTYNDGSILSMTTGTDSFFCTDGTTFFVEFEGTVTGGKGRFENATGTWEGSAEAVNARVTSRVKVDLD